MMENCHTQAMGGGGGGGGGGGEEGGGGLGEKEGSMGCGIVCVCIYTCVGK